MSGFKDLSGRKFNRITVLKRVENRGKNPRYLCLCSCGNYKVIRGDAILCGETKSCGCYSKEKLFIRNLKHGLIEIPEYHVWLGMKQRCFNVKTEQYKNYGARGITVCKRWLDSFDNFINDMGRKPTSKHTLERIDVNGNYTYFNCKWATMKEQSNNKTNNRILEYKGVQKTLMQWMSELNLKYTTVLYRLNKGWSIEDAFNKPLRFRK